MNCGRCGSFIPPDAKVCPACGALATDSPPLPKQTVRVQCPDCQTIFPIDNISVHSVVCPYCGSVIAIVPVRASRTISGSSGRGGFSRAIKWLASFFIFLIVLLIVVYGALPSIIALYDNSNPGSGYTGSYEAYYNLQIAEIFYDSYSSLSYNVTAIAQGDLFGFGPGYLLNGLSNIGYWYQVGVSWNWSHANFVNHFNGFQMNYEVFSPSYQSVFPANGGGMKDFNGTVNSNDSVNIGLHFSGGSVIMSAVDLQTGASASVSYSSFGASSFVGSSTTNNGHTFTGLMTEWYHTNPENTKLEPVTYTISGQPISGATFLVDELNFTNNTPFKTPPILQYQTSATTSFTNPTQLHTIKLGPITVKASGYEFVT